MVWPYKRSKGYKCGRMCEIESAAKFPHLELMTPEILVPLTDLCNVLWKIPRQIRDAVIDVCEIVIRNNFDQFCD